MSRASFAESIHSRGWPRNFGAGTSGCTEIASSRKARPSRAQMRKTLLEVEEALFVVTEALGSSWVREFLDVSSNGPIVDPERLTRALEDLQDRATKHELPCNQSRRDEARAGKGLTGGDVASHIVRHHDLGSVEARP